jgi:hypothetical protein
MTDADFNRMVLTERIAAIEMLESMKEVPEPPKDCGHDCDCNDCEEASECQEKWEYGFDCDADCRNCNNDDCRDR